MMLYCVKCGDPIEKDELICDKCGYHFKLVEGRPATVYMNQVPGRNPAQGVNIGAQGQPAYGMGQPGMQNRGMQGQPVYGAGQPGMQNRGMQGQPAYGMGQPGVQNRGMQGQPVYGMGQPGMQNRGMQGQPPMRNIPVNKPKKKKTGLWIALGASACLLAMLCLCVIIGVGVFAGVGLMMLGSTEEEIMVNNGTGTTNNAPVVHDNSNNAAVAETLVSDAIRDPFVTLKGNGEDTVTIMMYLNGSDLESDYGMATQDIREILNATLSDNVRVVIQTGGTRKWQTSAIASDHSQRFLVENGALTLVDDSLGQLDVTDPQTLEDFITFCNTNYPANRNMLILWNHGSGAVYGFGYDEHVDDYWAALTLDEIQDAIRDSGVKFEMIGFDACLMGGLETACALYDYADYMIASEDFESGRGWEYQNWLTILGTNSSVSMEELSKVIVDDFVKESQSYGSDGILALVNLRYTRLLFQAWSDFAYSAKEDLLACNYSMEMTRTDRASLWFETPEERLMRDPWEALFDTDNEALLEEYCYAVDLMALADTLDTEEAKVLKSALSMALVYCSATSGDAEMTGLSITLPYDSRSFYEEMETVYTNCGFDAEYIEFLEEFVDAEVESFDWGQSEWGGWGSYQEEEFDWTEWEQWDTYESEDYGWDR